MSDPAAPSASGKAADPSIPELLHLGEQLAQARERAGMSLDELAKRLKSDPRLLQALEEGDSNRLPEGVFVVALAQRVAGVLHADLEDAIRAVRGRLALGPGLAAQPQAAGGATPSAPGPSAPVFRPLRWALAAPLAAAALASAWLVARPPAPQPSPAPSPPPRAIAPGPIPAQPASLRLRASEPSWVEVREVGGRTLFEGTLTGERGFPLGQGLEVIAGRPHAVRARVGEGPEAPLGGVADIRWQRFDRQGLSPAQSGSAPSPR